MAIDWSYIAQRTNLYMAHVDIHAKRSGCCCLTEASCAQCPIHSLDMRYQDPRLNELAAQSDGKDGG